MTSFNAVGITDAGQVRDQNQDTYLVRGDLVLIADGMGGYAGGEVAAEIAADVVGVSFATGSSGEGLGEAVQVANRRIFERGSEPGLEGMGTTLVAAAIIDTDRGPRVLLANVGDSRAYLLRDGRLSQLTEDHSVAAELVRMGRIDEVEGVEHPGRHVLTRALGVDLDVAPDLLELEPTAGDRLLLCSDGLSNELADGQILALLEVGAPSDAARALVAAANAHGGLDNITAVVADLVTEDDGSTSLHTDATPIPEVAPAPVPEPLAPLVPVVAVPDPVVSDPRGTSRVATNLVAPSEVSWVAPVTSALPVRPVLTGRQRRRRRREERRARRDLNKWVSIRGAAFVLAIAAVLAGGFGVLRWYGTSNYVVIVRSHHVEVIQGQLGGFLWWPAKRVVVYRFGPAQLPTTARAALVAGVTEPSLAAAKDYVTNMHNQWKAAHGLLGTPTTTTTTTYAP